MDTTGAITSIEPARPKPGAFARAGASAAVRLAIRVNGRTVVTLPERLVRELGLTVGQPWTAELSTRVLGAKTYARAMRQATNRLNRRAMSTQTLRRKLKDLNYDDEVSQRVIDKLTQTGALDDEAYGRTLIEQILARKPAGASLLRVKLLQKGLERVLVERLVGHSSETTDAVAQARALGERRLRALSRLDPATRKRRLWGLLARRGFDRDTIEDALQDLPGLTEEDGGFAE